MKSYCRVLAGLFVTSLISLFMLGCSSDDDDIDITTYEAELAGENQAREVASPASGTINAELDENNRLVLSGSFEGLTSPLAEIAGSSAHIHQGEPGEDGPVLININVTPGEDNRSGTLELTTDLTDEQADMLRNERLYVNIHTENYPGGELRAQLMDDPPTFEPVQWSTELDLRAEEQVHDVDTEATGFATAILRDDQSFVLSGAFDNLTSNLLQVEGASVNLYRGEAGAEGELLQNLEVVTEEDDRSGTFHFRTDLSEEEVEWLQNGELYINVHTEDYPDGELRAQLVEEQDTPIDELEAELAGDNEVPPVATPATGTIQFSLDGNTLTLTGDFEGLTSDLIEIADSSAHIHQAEAGESGPVVFNIDVTAEEDQRSGTLDLTVELDEDQLQAFNDGLYYVNIHTENYPAGELRAQLVEDAPQFEPVQWSIEVALSEEDHAHVVDTDATGFLTAILREDNRFILSGAFEGLSSPLEEIEGSSAHVHRAPEEESGPIVFNVEVLSEDGLSGTFHAERTLSEEELEWLQEGELYINIHTEDYPAGELRGQLVEGEDPTPPIQ